MNRRALSLMIVIIGLGFGYVLLKSTTELPEPTVVISEVTVEPSSVEEVVIVPYMEPTAVILTPEEMRLSMKIVFDAIQSIDLCKSMYIIGSAANIQGAIEYGETYYYQLMTGQADLQPVITRQRLQRAMAVGLATCKHPAVTELFNFFATELNSP